jgi:hypothetical protein
MILLTIEWTKAQAVAAFITGVVSIILAIWAFISGRMNHKLTVKSQQELELLKSDFAKDIEKLKNELSERKSESDARRVYEFEARKRLYHEYEPLLFQLMEASDNALHRIQSLARTAMHGDLGENGWLSQFNYYTKSTIYKLFVPLAIYQIMQRKLTLVDVSVDKSIGLHYKLAKQIYISYTDDFEFARGNPPIPYNPNHKDWQVLREKDPRSYWRQGLPMGLLDKSIEFLIEKGANDKERVISYGEFEKKIGNLGNDKISDVNLARDIFYLFHPKHRPILWRLLITQAVVFHTLLELKNVELSNINKDLVREALLKINADFISKFNWKQEGGPEVEEIKEPFQVAKEYLSKRF